MAIPRRIFQTFKTADLGWYTRFWVGRLKRQNPEFEYVFYDDAAIERFFSDHYPPEYLAAYQRLTVGAAKADFFRYAELYRNGGVYLDLDGYARKPLSSFIRDDDVALIAKEGLPTGFFAQWALIYDKGHPFLGKTLELVLDNIDNDRHLHDVHALTGPGVYTLAIKTVLAEQPDTPHRELSDNYDELLVAKYRLNKGFLYRDKSDHWKVAQQQRPILKPRSGDD